MKQPYNFKNVKFNISIIGFGSDFMPIDIKEQLFETFPNEIKYDRSLNFIFYPSYGNGELGLIYCFSEKLDRSIGNTYYFGWGAINKVSELYLFADEEHTTSYKKAEETMFKYILLKKYA